MATNGGVLVLLPEYLARVILAKWVEFKDVVHVDSALCTESPRKKYHDVLSSSYHPFAPFENEVERRDCSVAFVDWVVKRNVCLCAIVPPPKLETMPQLRKVFVQHIAPTVTRVHVKGKLTNTLYDVALYCHRVELLHITNCLYGDAEEVNTMGCLAIEDAFIRAVQANTGSLKRLVLFCCKAFGEESFVKAAEMCPALSHYDLTNAGLSNHALVQIVSTCTALTHLSIGLNEQVGDVGVRAVAEHCRHIEYLDVFHLRLTDSAFLAIARWCSALKHLAIGVNTDITDAALRELSSHCTELEVIIFTMGVRITDTGIINLAQGCKHLQHVQLGSMPGVTDAALIALANHCPELKHLQLSCCSIITDIGVQEIAQKCTHLRTVVLHGCWRVSSEMSAVFRSDVVVVNLGAYSVGSDDENFGSDALMNVFEDLDFDDFDEIEG